LDEGKQGRALLDEMIRMENVQVKKENQNAGISESKRNPEDMDPQAFV